MMTFTITLTVEFEKWEPRELAPESSDGGFVVRSVTPHREFHRVVVDVVAMSAEDAEQRVVGHINAIPGVVGVEVEDVGYGFGYEPPDTGPSL